MEGAAAVRVGVLLSEGALPAWAAGVLEALVRREGVQLALVVTCEGARDRRPPVLVRLYEGLDRRLFAGGPGALALAGVPPAARAAPQLRVRLGPERRLAPEDVESVRSHALDVLLDLGGVAPRGAVVTAARHGVWSWHHGDPIRHRGAPPLFWELHHGEPASESCLEVVADDGRESAAIYRSATSTDYVSLQRTRDAVLWKSAHFALRRLDDLVSGRPLPREIPQRPPADAQAMPSNRDAVRHAIALARRHGRRKLRNAALERQWFLGVRRRRPGRLPHEDDRPWTQILPPDDRYWADPFVVEARGETFVFLEEFRYARGRGELTVARLDPSAALGETQPVLSAPHHLSYPHVFRDSGRVFMVPESGAAARVELWVATDFPLRWERMAVLLEGRAAVDASLIRHDGLFWMWVNHAVPGARVDDESWLYFSDRVDAGWTPHPRNPVVSDARRARGAGRPFVHRGTLVRPAQDCTGRYGSRVVFNAVDLLTPEDYRERPVGTLGAEWAGGRTLGAHTYTFDGDWEAVDGLRRIPRWRAAVARGRRRWREAPARP